jgi:hypothetical protein
MSNPGFRARMMVSAHRRLISLSRHRASASGITIPLTSERLVNLPGQFHVWLVSPEAEFLKGKFVWVNWDVDELIAGAEELKYPMALQVGLNGVPF